MKIKVLVAFLLCFSFISAQAQTTKIDIEQAISVALENNHDTKIALMNVRKANAAVNEAFGYALPSVDFNASFTHSIEKMKVPFPDFGAMLTNATYSILFDEGVIPRDDSKYLPMRTELMSMALANNYSAKLQVSQILFNSAVFRGIGASAIYLETSKEMLKSVAVNTILNVEKAFNGVLLTQEMLKILNESYQNALDNLKNVQALYKQGLVSEFDVLQVEVQVENIRPSIIQLENALKNAKDGLKLIMGLDANVEIELIGELAIDDWNLIEQEIAIERTKNNNFDVRTLQNKIEVDEAFIDLDRSEYWPSLVAFANYSKMGASDKFDFINYSESMVGLQFSINLFNGMRTNHKVQQSKVTKLQSQQQLIQLQDFLVTQVRLKYAEIQRINENLLAQERNVTLAQRAYDISNTRYREGTGTQLEIKNSEMELRIAKTNRLQSVYDFIVAQAELNQLMGNVKSDYLKIVDKKITEIINTK